MKYENHVTTEQQARADAAQSVTNHEIFKRGYDAYKARKARNKRRILIGGEDAEESERRGFTS